MVALYRCDRQADALQAYQDARRTLVDELGIEPGQRLRELERAILGAGRGARVAGSAAARGDRPSAGRAADARCSSSPARPSSRARRSSRGCASCGQHGDRVTVVLARRGRHRQDAAGRRARRAACAARVLYGRCDEGLAVPYQPFVQALRPVATTMGRRAAAGGAGLARARARAAAARARGLGEPARAEPETERLALFEAVAALLEAATRERRALLVLDDLHWAPRADAAAAPASDPLRARAAG